MSPLLTAVAPEPAKEIPNVRPTDAPAAVDPTPPWDRSWLWCAKGERKTLLWVILIHALSLTGFILFPTPGWILFGASYALFFLGGLGTTVAYHRSLAHRAVKLNPIVEFPLIGAALFNGSGTPATWAANHRLHHAKSDTDGDISSPRLGGFWWSHLRWLWQTEQTSIKKWAPDLDKGRYRVFTKFQVPLLAASLFAGAAFGWAAFFWLGPIRLMLALHAQCFTNSLAHMKKNVQAGEDSSLNRWWLAPVQAMQGENWHGNHHRSPASAKLGRQWYQIDCGWYFILACEKLGLAKNVRRPRFGE